MKKYEYLKKQYPEFVSLNQLYQICKISKRSAHYLLTHNIIPCVVNSNQTWRYKIALDDVITYLMRREQLGSMIPRGATSNKKRNLPKNKTGIFAANSTDISSYFDNLYINCPNILSVADIEQLTGLSKATIRKYIKEEKLESVICDKIYYVPKSSFLEFVKSKYFINCNSCSGLFKEIIYGFSTLK